MPTIPPLPSPKAAWDVWGAGVDAAARNAVLKWQPSTAYTAGDIVINPSGQTVTANATFTSGASYSASNWTVVAGGGGTVTDATTTAKGVVQLAGDLAGTAAAPTVPGLAAKAPTASPTFTGTVSGVTKAMVGLGNVDNTADTAKPISTATQTALNAKLDSTTAAATYVAKTDAIDLESTQDSIAGMFTGGTHSGISFSYNDPGNVINATVTPGSVADATTTTKGAVQLAGDLAGTASAPTVPGLAGKETAGAAATAQAFAIQRANHTGTQAASTITGLSTVATSGAYTDLSAKPTIPTVGAAGAGAAVALSSTDASVTNARTPTAHTHPASDLTATGTRDATTFLRGDNTWAVPAGGGGSGGVAGYSTYTMPAGAVAVTLDRMSASMQSVTLVSGTRYMTAVALSAGSVVNALNMRTNGYSGGTHAWLGLFDANRVALAVSADDTIATMPSGTRTFTLTSAYSVPTTGLYYVALTLVGTSPAVIGVNGAGAAGHTIPPITAATSNTGETVPPSVGSTATALTASSVVPYIWLT